MSDKILYGYTGIFNTPDEIIHAANEVAEKGYKKYDVNTPYPVHGMDKAMKLPPSKLGYAALVFGLSGTLAALALMYWTSVIDYPNVIGGKPFFAFPAFVPIIFEVTVLAAAIATVVTMIAVFFKFPNLVHPLHDTPYMKKVSSDKYGLYIQAEDEKFDVEGVKNLFKELGASEINPVYFDNDEISHEHKVWEPKFIGLLILVAIITSGSVYFALNKLMYMTPFNWMMEQDKSIPQQTSNFFSDGFAMRPPVQGTVSRGNMPYQFTGSPETAEILLTNPLTPNEESLALGKIKYNIYCSPCHGYFGEGDSRMRGQFPNPPSFHSEKVRNWSDGRIFHVITEGQNIMPNYASQLNRQERWATVLYIRALQRSFNAKESDLE
jgi:mono/diheme cytochrome c family protein